MWCRVGQRIWFILVQTWAEVGRLASAYIVLARAMRLSPFRCVSARFRTSMYRTLSARYVMYRYAASRYPSITGVLIRCCAAQRGIRALKSICACLRGRRDSELMSECSAESNGGMFCCALLLKYSEARPSSESHVSGSRRTNVSYSRRQRLLSWLEEHDHGKIALRSGATTMSLR